MPFGDDSIEEVPAPANGTTDGGINVSLASALQTLPSFNTPSMSSHSTSKRTSPTGIATSKSMGSLSSCNRSTSLGISSKLAAPSKLISLDSGIAGEANRPSLSHKSALDQLAEPARNRGGLVLKLPFQGTHPEFDREIDPFGVVHVRMTIAGHGVFEASSAMVRLRPYSSPRDNQQQLRGRRFFYQETTGRGDRAGLTWPVN